MTYIDIHTHTYYQDPETTLVLNVFPEEDDKLKLPALFSVGLHPWHVEENNRKARMEKVKELASGRQVIAIGETGLDKAIGSPFDLQALVFSEHLALAESLRKPVIIHCVRAYSEMLALRKKSDQAIPWIFHWFNADEQIARELLRKNGYLSFGHMLFNEHSKAYRVFPKIPLERIFLETDDAGYTIREIYERAAFLRNTNVGELQSGIMLNFKRCFYD